MAGLWEEYSASAALSTEGTTAAEELFHNEVDDHLFASAPITIVDAIATLFVIGTDLWQVSFAVVNEDMSSAQVQLLQRHERPMWYSFYAIGGPLVFRMKSKKTIYPEEKLWVRWRKAEGSASETARMGIQLFMVRHQ